MRLGRGTPPVAPAGADASTVVRFPGRTARRRRATRWGVAAAVLAVLGALGWVVFFSPVLAADRVEVTGTWGSTPRETGAAMFVTASATQGTIGGGQLEYMAIDRARQMLARDEAQARMNIPLGPEIGQCCGGRVELSLARADETSAPQNLPQVLIFGAGHVGRALARALALLPLRRACRRGPRRAVAHSHGSKSPTAPGSPVHGCGC